MKQSLPSFVDLLSSLGLNDNDHPSHLRTQRPSHEIHLRTDSWDSAHSSASSQRTSPIHPPQVRLSGRQSSYSSIAGQSRRFSPYGAPRDLNDRRGSLPSLTIFPPQPNGGTGNSPPTYSRANTSSSIAAQRRRSGSLPTLLESPFAFMSSLREAQHPSEESIEEDDISSVVTSAITSPGSSNTSPYAYTFPPPDRDSSNNSNHRSNGSTNRSTNSTSRTPSSSETPNAGSHTTISFLPPLAPLSPQKRHLTPRTRLSIAISSPSPPAPSSPSPVRSPVFNPSNKHTTTATAIAIATPIPPSPFRSHHAHHPSASDLKHSSTTTSSLSPSSGGRRLSPTISPPISSFIRKSASNANLSPNGSATSPIRTHHPHPYAKPTSPIETSTLYRLDDPSGVGAGLERQRVKRRGSMTLSLAPLSLSRLNRQSHATHHRRTTSSSSTHSLRSPTDSIVNGSVGSSSTATSTTMPTPRTPLSPMAIPTLPEAVGLVQRNMIFTGAITPSSLSPSVQPQAGMQVPTLPSFFPPVLPTLPVLAPLSSGPKPERRQRAAAKMRSMGHIRTGSWDRERDVDKGKRRMRSFAGSSSFLAASGAVTASSGKHALHTNSLPPSSWAARAPCLPKRNFTAPAIIIKQEEVDSEIDELEVDELTPESNAVGNGKPSNRLSRQHQQYDHDEHDTGYASTSTASATSGGSAGSHSEGSSVRDGYDAQDEMQLDDPDEYEGGVGISIMSQRRASLHPLDGNHPNGMHHHVRSHSDQGPNGNTRLTGAYGTGNGRLGPSPFSSLSSSSSTGKLRSLVDRGRIVSPSHNFPADREILPFSSSSSPSSMKIPRISRSTASDSPSPAHSSPSSASTTGARTPTGLSSTGGSANATPARRSPPSVIVSSAA